MVLAIERVASPMKKVLAGIGLKGDDFMVEGMILFSKS